MKDMEKNLISPNNHILLSSHIH